MKSVKFSLFVLACVLGFLAAYVAAAPTVLSDKHAESMFGSLVTCGSCVWANTTGCPKSKDAGEFQYCVAQYADGCGGEAQGKKTCQPQGIGCSAQYCDEVSETYACKE